MGRHNVDKSGDPRGSQTVGQRQGSGKQKKQGTARRQGKLDGEEVELLLNMGRYTCEGPAERIADDHMLLPEIGFCTETHKRKKWLQQVQG
ncbi:uncharacterized protein N7518_008334 [Penicillium psychrosexuale]|uniref:uncharacterized protein n=1 Tax=Penicillium psychrosexuale TaxID=1002107 RepID=UPI002544FCF6|nr:uncharacterized protein N7518_008334 [Penicillium psychrosexuale]KAJ5791323.1 hypothetical protein N7518_008334 [Penicillium psychrosexuale]